MAYHRCVRQNDIEGNVHLTRVHPVISRPSRRSRHHHSSVISRDLDEGVGHLPYTPSRFTENWRVPYHLRSCTGYMCSIQFTHSPRIGSEYVDSRSRCCCGSQGPPVRIFRQPDSDDTNAPRAVLLSTAPCAHDLLGTACLVPGPRCGSESDVVSCRHVPPSPCQGHPFPRSVTYTTPLLSSSPHYCIFFYRKYAGTKIDSYLGDSG